MKIFQIFAECASSIKYLKCDIEENGLERLPYQFQSLYLWSASLDLMFQLSKKNFFIHTEGILTIMNIFIYWICLIKIFI